MKHKFEIGKQTYDVHVSELSEQHAKVEVNGELFDVRIDTCSDTNTQKLMPKRDCFQTGVAAPTAPSPSPRSAEPSAGASAVTAPIPGQVIDIQVKVGDPVGAGQTVAILEAMKMENTVVSNSAGTVKSIRVDRGADVATGDVIMIIE